MAFKYKHIEIICEKHGSYMRREDDVDRGCVKCNKERKDAIYLDKWKKDCEKIHGGKYSYENTIKTNVLEKTNIYCKNCKMEFFQTMASHKIGRGCPNCKSTKGYKYTVSDIEDFYKSIGLNYDLSNSVYKGCKNKMEIKCDKGHIFYTTPDEIINSKRKCPTCSRGNNTSKGEKELLEFIKSLRFEVITNNRAILDGKELDIYIPELKLAIEYNGVYWHSDEKAKMSVQDKMKLCYEKDINVLNIYENDWRNRRCFVENKLKRILGYKIYRKFYHKSNIKVSEYRTLPAKYEEIFCNNFTRLDFKPDFYIVMDTINSNQNIAICPIMKVDNGFVIIDVISELHFFSNYYDLVIEYFRQFGNYKVLAYTEWLDFLKILNNNGFINDVIHSKPMYVNGHNLSYDVESKITLTKPNICVYNI